jgi:hypothetical protein
VQGSAGKIHMAKYFEGAGFDAGMVEFRDKKQIKGKYLVHGDKDVLCYVVEGMDVLRLKDQTQKIVPGSICYILKNTSCDFIANLPSLRLFYVLTDTVD